MSFSRRADDGTVMVVDPTGAERPFNLDALKSDIKAKTGKSVDSVQFNTPENPVEVSPLTLGERFATRGVGNTKGSINYLKGKYDDVKYDADSGKMVVNNKGVWQSVDPSGLGGGSAWDKTKELAKEVADNSDMLLSGYAMAKGAAGGAIAGAPLGPGGAIAGGILGAGAASGAAAGIRTTFGRALGTYDATPEEQLQDVALETVIGMGGQAVGPGVKMGLDKLVKTGTVLKGMASRGTQDVISEVYGGMTGVGQPAMRALMKDPGKMVGQMKDLVAKAGPGADYNTIRGEAIKQGMADITAIAEKAHGQLPNRYGKLLNEIFDEAGEKGFKADMTSIADDSMKSIEAAGLGKFVSKTPKGPKEFVPFTSESAASHIAETGGDAISMTPEMIKTVKPIIDDIVAMGKQGTLEGRNGAKAITAFQKNLNRLKDTAFRSNSDPTLERMTMAAVNGFEDGVSKAFDNVGLGAKYAQKAQLYGQYSNASNMARKIVRDASGGKEAEKVLKTVLSEADRNLVPKGQVGLIIDLAGGDAAKTFEKLQLRDAASKFSSFRPRWGLAGSGTAGATAALTGQTVLQKGLAGTASSIGILPAAGIAAGATQLSPRFVAGQSAVAQKALPYAGKAMDFVKSLGPKQLAQLLKDDKAFGALIGQSAKAMMNQDQTTQQLLQGALGGSGNE